MPGQKDMGKQKKNIKNFDFEKQPGRVRKNCGLKIERPLMSIITPFYNAGRYFEQTFNCVMNQTFIWFEWIIVDDGSTSRSDVEKMEALADLDDRVRVFHMKNSGPAAARNYAVSKAQTDLIVSLDSDDLIEPVYLDQTYFALYFHPEATWAYTDSLGFQQWKYVWKVHFDSEKLKKRNFLIEIGTFRKKAFEEVGGYDDMQKHSHEDWNLWLRFLANGGFPIHIASLSSWYRIVSDGALHKTNDNKEVKKRAYERIDEIACQIAGRIEAIEYPRVDTCSSDYYPKCSDWKLKKNKSETEVLMIVTDMNADEEGYLNLEFVKARNSEQFHIGIFTVSDCDNSLKQKFEEYVDDLFELPAFLDWKDYAEFISYYIKSRQVDIVLIRNTHYGYHVIPWIRNKFPQLKIVTDTIEGKEELWKMENLADHYLSLYGELVACQENVKRLREKGDRENRILRLINR